MATENENLVVTPYSLSFSEKQILEEKIGNVPYSTVSLFELKGQNLFSGVFSLLSTKAKRFYLFYEDPTLTPLERVLIGLSLFLRGGRITLISPGADQKDITKWEAIKSFFGIGFYSLGNFFYLIFAAIQILILKMIPQKNYATKEGSILYLCTSFSLGTKAGGSVAHIAGVVNGFLKLGHKIVYAGSRKPAMVEGEYDFVGIQRPSYYGYPTELNNFYLNQKMYRFLRKKVKPPISFIYQRMSVGNFTGVLLSRFFKVPLIIEYNGSEIWVSKNWSQKPFFAIQLFEAAENICFKHAQYVMTVSDVLKEELIERGISEERIITYPNCVDPEVYDSKLYQGKKSQIRDKWHIEQDALVVSFLGTFGRWHGVSVLAQAISNLYKNKKDWLDNRNIKFLLIGDGLEMPKVREILKDVPSKYVQMTGLVRQKHGPELLASSDILVTPQVPNQDGTRFFGSPTKLFEYMSLGKPIVASNLEQIGQVLEGSNSIDQATPIVENWNTSCGVLTTPGSIDDIEKAIEFLIENPKVAEVIGKNANSKVQQKYTWKHHVQVILDHVKDLEAQSSNIHFLKYNKLFRNEDPYGYKKRIDYTIEVVRRLKPKNILDFGCGTGELFTLPLAMKLPNTKIVAYDEDRTSVEFGQNHSFSKNITFTDQPPEKGSEKFDLIILSEVIEHVDHPTELLSHLRSMLAPGGNILVTTPNGYGAFEILNTIQGLVKLALRFNPVEKQKKITGDAEATLAISPHVQFFTESHLNKVIDYSGLQTEEMRNRTFLCGFGLDFLGYLPGFSKVNASIADQLPHSFVSGWMFLLKEQPDSITSNELVDDDLSQYENFYTGFKRRLNQKLYLNNIRPTQHS